MTIETIVHLLLEKLAPASETDIQSADEATTVQPWRTLIWWAFALLKQNTSGLVSVNFSVDQ